MWAVRRPIGSCGLQEEAIESRALAYYEHWDCIWIILGLYWGYIGVILGLYWGYIGVILGLYWGHIGDACAMIA